MLKRVRWDKVRRRRADGETQVETGSSEEAGEQQCCVVAVEYGARSRQGAVVDVDVLDLFQFERAADGTHVAMMLPHQTRLTGVCQNQELL